MRAFAAVVALLPSGTLTAQPALPVIDVHLHALPADSQGPPPLAMCVPTASWPAWIRCAVSALRVDPSRPAVRTRSSRP